MSLSNKPETTIAIACHNKQLVYGGLNAEYTNKFTDTEIKWESIIQIQLNQIQTNEMMDSWNLILNELILFKIKFKSFNDQSLIKSRSNSNTETALVSVSNSTSQHLHFGDTFWYLC